MLLQVYVQHRIVEAGAELCEMMLKRNGHFYVCGSARQVPEAGPWLCASSFGSLSTECQS